VWRSFFSSSSPRLYSDVVPFLLSSWPTRYPLMLLSWSRSSSTPSLCESSSAVYRLVIAIVALVHTVINNWCRKCHIKNVQDSQALVYVHDTHALVLALTNNSLICLDVEAIGDNGTAGVFFSRPLFNVSIFRHKVIGQRTSLVTTSPFVASFPSKAPQMAPTSSLQ
jgi:hypothetical protein